MEVNKMVNGPVKEATCKGCGVVGKTAHMGAKATKAAMKGTWKCVTCLNK